jgi:hypothetical protein
LHYKFQDPGVYQVELHFAGLRFNADDMTFLSHASDIRAELGFGKAVYIINVGARPAQQSEYITNVVIANNDLASDAAVKSGLRDAQGTLTTSYYQNNNQNPHDLVYPDASSQDSTRFPVFPVANYQATGTSPKPLMITYENQRTPIVAEADIQFFRSREVQYDGFEHSGARMSKFAGVGCWDYTYPGNGEQIPATLLGSNFQTARKTNTFPPNWMPSNWDASTNSVMAHSIVTSRNYVRQIIEDPTRNVDQQAKDIENDMSIVHSYTIYDRNGSPMPANRFGYDALGRLETGCGLQAVNSTITYLGPNCNFEEAHQGTLVTYRTAPDAAGGNWDELINSHAAFYDWWEIKYVWFMRYMTPTGQIEKRVIRTGNLAEIWMLHNLANNNSQWENIVKDIAPFVDENSATGLLQNDPNSNFTAPNLMKNLGDRKIRVRIPLFEGGLLQGSTDLTNPDMSMMHNPIRNITNTASYNTYQGIWNNGIRPVKFNTPTEPTVIEIGFQIFHPTMNWEGRDPATPGGTDYAYYDAVYWGPESSTQQTPTTEDAFAGNGYTFGRHSFSAWNYTGSRKVHPINGTQDNEASLIGLDLAAIGAQTDVGGFEQNPGDIGVTYNAPGGRLDDFVDIIVLDSKAPILLTSVSNQDASLTNDNTLSAMTGGRADRDVYVEAWDYNPYAVFDGASQVWDDPSGGQGPRLKVPSIVNFSYDVGYDTRNHFGMGLHANPVSGTQNQLLYGFNLSYTNMDNLGNAANTKNIPSFDLNEQNLSNQLIGTADPVTVPSPGFNFHRASMLNNYDFFVYPELATGTSYPADGLLISKEWDDNLFPQQSEEDLSFTRITNVNGGLNVPYFYPPRDAEINQRAGLRTSNINNTSGNISQKQITFIPENPDLPYGFAPDYNGNGPTSFDPALTIVKHYTDSEDDYNTSDACNDSYDPFTTDSDTCWIRTRWMVPKEKIIAPYFANGWGTNLTQDYGFYAKARDVRILESGVTAPINGFGSWPFSRNWSRFVGAENYNFGAEHDDVTLTSGSVSDLVGQVYFNPMQNRSDRIGTMTVRDNQSPNFRITMTDYKTRQQVQYTVVSAQGFDPTIEDHSDRMFFFKTADPRSTTYPGLIESCAQLQENSIVKSQENDLWLNELIATGPNPCGGDWKSQAFVAIEDVRFQIRVEVTDNRSLDNSFIEIKSIASDVTRFPTPVLPDGSGDFEILDDDTDGNYAIHRFPDASSTSGNQRLYRHSKILTAHHMYPNAGFYDVIQITVGDNPQGSNPNTRTFHIPIVVVGQTVHFRQIGNDKTGIR